MRKQRVVKIGGSLLTHKSGFCELDETQIREFGRQLAELVAARALDEVVVVAGGGSFGNAIPKRFALDAPGRLDVRDVSRMTIGMFSLMSGLADLWREYELATYPVQASAIVQPSVSGFSVDCGLIDRLTAKGIIPLVTGDLIPSREWPILSSDWLPVLMARQGGVESVCYLTDVDGVYKLQDQQKAGAVFDTVTASNLASVQSAAGASCHQDVTGGMKTKVQAAAELLRLRVPTLIANGAAKDALIRALMGPWTDGTRFEVNELEGVAR